jgi:ABC-type transport system involved in multi-copper enzyme maturation permease subunit
MKRRIIGLLLFVVLTFSFLASGFGNCAESSVKVPFSYDELAANFSVSSPVENYTYSNSTIEIKADVYIGAHDYVKDSHYIPYQNISCIYSLDNSEWQNMTLASTSQPYIFPSLVNNYWYVTMWLNYTAVLHNVTEGQHNLKIDLNPEGIRSIEEGGEGKPLIQFTVNNQPSTKWFLISVIITVIIVSVVVVFVYFRKNRVKNQKIR